MNLEQYIPEDIRNIYEIHDFKHAAAILANEFPKEFMEICQALRTFSLTHDDIKSPGGNESTIPKKISAVLRPMGWVEGRLNAVFRELGVMNKYGASTTQMGKLLPRLESGRNGGCPILVFGITPNVINRSVIIETRVTTGEQIIVDDIASTLGNVDE